MSYQKTSKITCVILKKDSEKVIEYLRSVGMDSIFIAHGRSSILGTNRGLAKILNGEYHLLSEPVSHLSIFCDRSDSDSILRSIGLMAKQGSVVLEDYDSKGFMQSKKLCFAEADVSHNLHFYKQLVGISCIVQRGEGDIISKCVLELGSSVPSVRFGTGMGLRDKLGLLRITIPAEKEVVSFVVHAHDADAAMEALITAGQLDQPGKGFIYAHPINCGVVDTKIRQGRDGQAASIEQIVAAIDKISGSVDWRHSGIMSESSSRRYIKGSELILYCPEDLSSDLINKLMAVGAPGATIVKSLLVELNSPEGSHHHSAAWVSCNMIVQNNQIETILKALDSENFFSDAGRGFVNFRPISKAFTFLSKVSKAA